MVVIQAHKAVGESTEIPLTYYLNNVAATISLLQIMDDYDCTRIVYSSSATVYGTPPDIPIPETTRLKAESPYGKTKVMSEMIIEDLCHCESSRIFQSRIRLTPTKQNLLNGKPFLCVISSDCLLRCIL
jgi:UDP-glucose 4-epimerase